MEQNRKAGQNPPRVVAPTEEEEELVRLVGYLKIIMYEKLPAIFLSDSNSIE